MKYLLLVVAFLLIQIELIAQPCPTGFDGPEIVTYEPCPGCTIKATWCCTFIETTFGTKPAIHFSDVEVIGENCNFCLDWVMTSSGWAIPVIPWEALIGKVLISRKLCFPDIPSIPPCDPAPPAIYNMIVTNGGCYTRTETMEGVKYTPCSINAQGLCYENYKICWELVNGVMTMIVEGQNKQPGFNCIIPNCYPMCE
jgi:hypothetical protein